MSDIYLWETYDRLGREALDRRDLSQAAEAFRSAVATAEGLEPQDRLVLSLRNLAATLIEQGMVSDAYELLLRTLEVAKESLGKENSQTIETQRDLAGVCQGLGFLDKSEGYLKAVLAAETQTGQSEQSTSTLEELAGLAMSRDNPSKAARYYKQIVNIRTEQLGASHPDVAQILLRYSTALYQSGQAEEAETSMACAFDILKTQFAEEPTHLAQSLLAGAQLMVESGQLEPALAHQKRALDILSENLSVTDNRLWETRELIASSLAGLGKVDEAIELLEYCLRNREHLEDYKQGAMLKNLGGLYLTTGKTEKAEELYNSAAEILERTLGPEHPAYLATQEERVQLYHFSGRSKEALDIALRCIKVTENRFGPGHPNTAQTYASTALLAHNAEEWETALELMRAAEKIWQSLRPQPEDVLANCRTNIATCLLKLQRFDEVEGTLLLAEEVAGPSLRPVIANLRQQLAAGREQTEEPTVEENHPEPTEVETPTNPVDDDFSLPDIEDMIASAAPLSQAKNESIEAADSPSDRDLDLDLDLDVDVEPEATQANEGETDIIAAEEAPEPKAPEAEESFTERRKAGRRHLDLNHFFDLKVSRAQEGTPQAVKSFFVDLAPGGLRINSETAFPTEGELVLTLPKELLGEETQLKAEVVWQKSLFGNSILQGLAFRDLTSVQQHLLGKKLNSETVPDRSNSRQHYRLYRPFPIRLQAEGQDDWITSYATDLSIDGLGTRLNTQFEQGNQLRIRLELEFELPTVEVEARVAWAREGENGISHGLQFDSVGPVEAKTIKRYIDRCLLFSPD